MTEIPNSAIKPIAADTLNESPATNNARIPPTIAMGMTESASSVSERDEKFSQRRSAMRARLNGTAICNLPIAS